MRAKPFTFGRLEASDEAGSGFGWSAADNQQCSRSLASDVLKTLLLV
jgi:hypothetical protein